MNVLFVAGFSPIVADPVGASTFYREDLGLPLDTVAGDYIAVDNWGDSRHLGIWPLADAAQSCFGVRTWPSDLPIPQATLELEVDDVPRAAAELTAKGYKLIHHARTEPWGQEIARLLTPDGLLIGLSWCPWMHT